MNKIFIGIVLCFLSELLAAQTLKVLHKTDLKPIENLIIYKTDKSKSVLTNSKGEADISIFSETDELEIQHPAYKTVRFVKSDFKNSGYTLLLNESVIDIEEVVVSANKWEQEKSEIPNRMAVISARQARFFNPQTSADLIGSSGDVFVQKSQLGGGSPMIRGFAANRVLIVVDGVRMNNAIYRSGNLQNVLNLDPNFVEGSEIIFGPGSNIYGSDALGGVMDFHTHTPAFSGDGKLVTRASVMGRYSSANNENAGYFGFNTGQRKWSLLAGVSYSSFGDLKMGSHSHSEYQRNWYVQRIDGIDSVIKNNDPDVQKFTGYNQRNYLGKIRIKPVEKLDIVLSLHYSETSDVPRYDRLIEINDQGNPGSSEWYYGPQKWMMGNLTATLSAANFVYDKLKINLAKQDYEESRNSRKFRNSQLKQQMEEVSLVSLNIDAEKSLGPDMDKDRLFYGAEICYNDVVSTAHKKHIVTNEISTTATRYPDENEYSTAALYASYMKRLGEMWRISAGTRYSLVSSASTFTDTSIMHFPFTGIDLTTSAFTGSLGLVFLPTDDFKMNVNASTGFRAPNIDDLGKVFDTDTIFLIVPNENLKPEYAWNFDLGFEKRFGSFAKAEITGFFTYIEDAIVQRDFIFNGKDSVLYEGVMSKVQAMVNASSATIYGVQASAMADIAENFALKTNFTWMDGEDNEGNSLQHVTPAFGSTHFIFTHKRIKADLYASYSAMVKANDLAPDEKAKVFIYAKDKDGKPYSPSWFTLNLKASFQITNQLQAYAGIENIFDLRYRPYSSGVVAPGRNFMVSVRFDL